MTSKALTFTVSTLMDELGRAEVISHLGVTRSAIGHAERDNIMPAWWFDPLEKLAGRELPRRLFRWDRKPYGSDSGAAA